VNVFQQVPKHVLRLDWPGAPNGIGPLMEPRNGTITNLGGTIKAAGVCGVYRNFAYAIGDQRLPPVRIRQGLAVVSEVLSNVVYTGGFIGADPPAPATATLDLATDPFADLNALYFSYPRCLAPEDSLSLNQGFTVKIGTSTTRPLTTSIFISLGAQSDGSQYVNNTFTTP
jgi:hypothetical protein